MEIDFLSDYYSAFFAINISLGVILFAFIFLQILKILHDYKYQVFGAKLKWRITFISVCMALIPAVLVYTVSVKFINRSIENWFDERIENALNSGIQLGQATLDSLYADQVNKAKLLSEELSLLTNEESQRLELLKYVETKNIQSAALFNANNGELLVSAIHHSIDFKNNSVSNFKNPFASLPLLSDLKTAKTQTVTNIFENSNTNNNTNTNNKNKNELFVRILMPLQSNNANLNLNLSYNYNRLHSANENQNQPKILQIIQQVPLNVAENLNAVQEVYKDYQALQLERSGLNRIYIMTLTFTMLVAMFSAFLFTFYIARRLTAPLLFLSEGTKAVMQGDFSTRNDKIFLKHQHSRDELSTLTQLFGKMTNQLRQARQDNERHRIEIEAAHAYLESILANISAGVLVFDKHLILRTANGGAKNILDDNLRGLLHTSLLKWERQKELSKNLLNQFTSEGNNANNININNNIGKRFSSNSNSNSNSNNNNNNQWQLQLEIPERQQVLLLRGSKLPNNNGEVVVFDDITKIIAGERSAAWGEVARRLAHEIKNPLTPIQLSAERLQFKLEDQQLNDTNKNILQKGTQTIINQVQAMKRMVDDFREYARLPMPELKPLNINELITEMLGLYESSNAKIILNLQHNLPLVIGDATQLRQVIHNLLRNAEDALESKINDEKIITISTEISDEVIATNSKYIKLKIADNGDGFPPELLSKIFEPYVTTKPKGTGLGLPIVKKIIEEHNGKISIKNICDAKDKNKVCGAEISIYLMQNVE